MEKLNEQDHYGSIGAAALCAPVAAQQPATPQARQGSDQQQMINQAFSEQFADSQIAVSGLTPDKIIDVQQALKKKGLNVGNPDGHWGKLSAEALKDFQRSHDLPTSGGALDRATLMDLGLNPTEFGFLTPGRAAPETTGQAPRSSGNERPRSQPNQGGAGQCPH